MKSEIDARINIIDQQTRVRRENNMIEEAFTSREIDTGEYECHECSGPFVVGERPVKNGDGYLKHEGCESNSLSHPIQPIVWSDDECIRFKSNKIVQFLLDGGPFDLNIIGAKEFTREDREQFAQLIGYSVSAFGELDYASPRVIEEADGVAHVMHEQRRREEGEEG